MSPPNLNRRINRLIKRMNRATDRTAVRTYLRRLARRGQAFLSRLRGEPTAMPPSLDCPDNLQTPTRPIEEVRQSLADRAARLNTEEDSNRQ
jgi:hypothetical protein